MVQPSKQGDLGENQGERLLPVLTLPSRFVFEQPFPEAVHLSVRTPSPFQNASSKDFMLARKATPGAKDGKQTWLQDEHERLPLWRKESEFRKDLSNPFKFAEICG